MSVMHLKIPATERSPEVDFDFGAGRLALSGESYPEDVAAFFGPVIAALGTYLAPASLSERNDGGAIQFDIRLQYFNSSSAKALMNILQMLEEAAGAGRPVTVNWHYAQDDDTMAEFGEDFSEDLTRVDFRLLPAA